MNNEINGIPVETLENRLRPDPDQKSRFHSASGFIGNDDRLLEVLDRDNQIVNEKKLSHLELAQPLEKIVNLVLSENFYEGQSIVISDQTFIVSMEYFMGYQESPFEDGLKGNIDITVTRERDKKIILFSMILPEFIKRYGFYEGNVRYRVAPETIIEFFNLAPEENINHQPRSAV